MHECPREWRVARERAVERLREHASRGLVDRDIEDFLFKLNEGKQCLFTTSSCSGRVAILEGPSIFDKKNARIIVAWHDPSKCREMICRYTSNLESPNRRYVWVSLQPPILHVAACTLEDAKEIMRCGDTAGFNRSCMKPYRAGGFHVELAVSDKLTIIGGDCSVALQACGVLEIYKRRLERLEECLLAIEC